jgi:hypothetical protein
MRQAGLEQHGEFGCENITFKLLRNKGCIAALKKAMDQARDHELSLAELARPRQPVRYGFGETSLADMRAAFQNELKPLVDPDKEKVYRSRDEYVQAEKLKARGVRVFRWDMRGCGAGMAWARHPYHAGCSADLAAVVDAAIGWCRGWMIHGLSGVPAPHTVASTPGKASSACFTCSEVAVAAIGAVVAGVPATSSVSVNVPPVAVVASRCTPAGTSRP